MRKVFLMFLMLGSFLSVKCYASDFQTIANLPNARVTQCLDLKSLCTGQGIESSILLYKQGLFALNVGGININNTLYGDFSISTSLDKWSFLNVDYAWKNIIDTNIALWIGANIKDQTVTYGVSASLVKFEK